MLQLRSQTQEDVQRLLPHLQTANQRHYQDLPKHVKGQPLMHGRQKSQSQGKKCLSSGNMNDGTFNLVFLIQLFGSLAWPFPKAGYHFAGRVSCHSLPAKWRKVPLNQPNIVLFALSWDLGRLWREKEKLKQFQNAFMCSAMLQGVGTVTLLQRSKWVTLGLDVSITVLSEEDWSSEMRCQPDVCFWLTLSDW